MGILALKHMKNSLLKITILPQRRFAAAWGEEINL